jgi:hypothetical protein
MLGICVFWEVPEMSLLHSQRRHLELLKQPPWSLGLWNLAQYSTMALQATTFRVVLVEGGTRLVWLATMGLNGDHEQRFNLHCLVVRDFCLHERLSPASPISYATVQPVFPIMLWPGLHYYHGVPSNSVPKGGGRAGGYYGLNSLFGMVCATIKLYFTPPFCHFL